MAGWPTPMAGHPEAGNNDSSRKTVALAGWQSPTAGDAKSRAYQYDRHDKTKPRLSNEGLVAGAPSIGFPAPTGSSGQLNPAHSRWLQGFPSAWDRAAPTKAKSRRGMLAGYGNAIVPPLAAEFVRAMMEAL